MTLNISINLDNATFDEHWTFEASRILKEFAARLFESGFTADFPTKLRDANGNTVGQAEVQS